MDPSNSSTCGLRTNQSCPSISLMTLGGGLIAAGLVCIILRATSTGLSGMPYWGTGAMFAGGSVLVIATLFKCNVTRQTLKKHEALDPNRITAINIVSEGESSPPHYGCDITLRDQKHGIHRNLVQSQLGAILSFNHNISLASSSGITREQILEDCRRVDARQQSPAKHQEKAPAAEVQPAFKPLPPVITKNFPPTTKLEFNKLPPDDQIAKIELINKYIAAPSNETIYVCNVILNDASTVDCELTYITFTAIIGRKKKDKEFIYKSFM